jgi:hypothetical protein
MQSFRRRFVYIVWRITKGMYFIAAPEHDSTARGMRDPHPRARRAGGGRGGAEARKKPTVQPCEAPRYGRHVLALYRLGVRCTRCACMRRWDCLHSAMRVQTVSRFLEWGGGRRGRRSFRPTTQVQIVDLRRRGTPVSQARAQVSTRARRAGASRAIRASSIRGPA